MDFLKNNAFFSFQTPHVLEYMLCSFLKRTYVSSRRIPNVLNPFDPINRKPFGEF